MVERFLKMMFELVDWDDEKMMLDEVYLTLETHLLSNVYYFD